ncbi:MAG: MobA/MobL family protein, partial [Vibrionaceae bacterium]
MATYHFSVKIGSKGKARPHAAYIGREEKYAKIKDLKYKESGNMPSWAQHDAKEFWLATDQFERANGSAYRELEIALPRELNPAQRVELVQKFVKQEIGERHAYQFAIHNAKAAIDGGEQPHAHIMFCERINDGIERDPEHYFMRANSKNPQLGGAKKARFGETPTERKEHLIAQRERWADLQNRVLERYQHSVRVDARTLKAQGIDREAERHIGAGWVRKLPKEQLAALLELRAAVHEAVVQEQKCKNSPEFNA